MDGRAPWYDSTATIGGISNGGLPNITGAIGTGLSNFAYPLNFENAVGVMGLLGTSTMTMKATTPGATGSGGFSFDASRVSAVYDSGATVRPAAVYTNWCIKF